MRGKSPLYGMAIILAITGSVLFVPFMMATPARAATRNEVGISMNATLLRMKDKDLDERLNDVERMGATWIRMDFSWAAIQPDSPHVYHWRLYDRIVRAVDSHHLKMLAILDYTPRWAQEPRCSALVITHAAGQKCNPKSADLFAHFARTIALRYKTKSIRAWEIWNEPNLSSYWKTAQAHNAVLIDPKAYADLANAAAYQIRHCDPGTVILTGGLAPYFTPKYPKGMRQSDYLAQLLPHLNRDLFDGVGIHPYSWPVLPDKVAIYNAFYTVDNGPPEYNLRAVMAKAGWGRKQIWGTEFGAPTKGLNTMNNPAQHKRPDHVSEAMQAQIIERGIDDWHKKSNVGPLFVQSDSDQWLPKGKNGSGFGIRRSNGTEKPAYDALVKATRKLP